MPINFSDDERRRHAIRHAYRRLPQNIKRRRRCLTVPFLVLVYLVMFLLFGVGGDLLSHNLPVAVPSACAGLASGFGMGPGVSLQLLTTDKHTKQKYPFWVPFCSGCCVRYCIVDAVTTVTVSSSLVVLPVHECVLVFVVVN